MINSTIEEIVLDLELVGDRWVRDRVTGLKFRITEEPFSTSTKGGDTVFSVEIRTEEDWSSVGSDSFGLADERLQVIRDQYRREAEEVIQRRLDQMAENILEAIRGNEIW